MTTKMPFMALINPEITLVTEAVARGLGRLPVDSGHPRPGAAGAERSASRRSTATGKRVSFTAERPAGARHPARDRSSRRRAVLRPHAIARVARVHGRIPPVLDRGRRMSLTDDRRERAAIAPYFTNTDRPVFALVNLPETVKGALFARYSRSPKSLRRLFLDEFFEGVGGGGAGRRRRRRRRARRPAVPARLQRLRRRLGRAVGRRAPGRRGRVEHPDEGARARPADGVPRTVHALHSVHRAARRPVAVPRAGRTRRPSAARRVHRAR